MFVLRGGVRPGGRVDRQSAMLTRSASHRSRAGPAEGGASW
jgi:hypothetical protein